MHDNDYKAMYNKAVSDMFRGQFQFLDAHVEWKPCEAFWPGNTPSRSYRYLSREELLQEQKPKLYDKNTFLATILGDRPTWVRLIGAPDMLLVAGISNEGLYICNVGFRKWKDLADADWQWTQACYVSNYNDLIWRPFTRE